MTGFFVLLVGTVVGYLLVVGVLNLISHLLDH